MNCDLVFNIPCHVTLLRSTLSSLFSNIPTTKETSYMQFSSVRKPQNTKLHLIYSIKIKLIIHYPGFVCLSLFSCFRKVETHYISIPSDTLKLNIFKKKFYGPLLSNIRSRDMSICDIFDLSVWLYIKTENLRFYGIDFKSLFLMM